MLSAFLLTADSMAFAGKRILPHRLISLDAVLGGTVHTGFVQRLLGLLAAIESKGTERDAAERDDESASDADSGDENPEQSPLDLSPARIDALVATARAAKPENPAEALLQHAVTAVYWRGPQSTLHDQFLLDFVLYGLREACGFVLACEPPLGEIQSFVEFMAEGYVTAAAAFERNIDAVKADQERLAAQYHANGGDLLARLVVNEAMKYGGVWGDGRWDEKRGTLSEDRDARMWRAGISFRTVSY